MALFEDIIDILNHDGFKWQSFQSLSISLLLHLLPSLCLFFLQYFFGDTLAFSSVLFSLLRCSPPSLSLSVYKRSICPLLAFILIKKTKSHDLFENKKSLDCRLSTNYMKLISKCYKSFVDVSIFICIYYLLQQPKKPAAKFLELCVAFCAFSSFPVRFSVSVTTESI